MTGRFRTNVGDLARRQCEIPVSGLPTLEKNKFSIFSNFVKSSDFRGSNLTPLSWQQACSDTKLPLFSTNDAMCFVDCCPLEVMSLNITHVRV